MHAWITHTPCQSFFPSQSIPSPLVDPFVYLPVASFPLAAFVMTTLDDTVVGVLAAITTPISTNEFIGTCNLKSSSTSPNTKNGIMTKLMSWTRRCSRIRIKVWVRIRVRRDRPEIKKMIITAPASSNMSANPIITIFSLIEKVYATPLDGPFSMDITAFSCHIGSCVCQRNDKGKTNKKPVLFQQCQRHRFDLFHFAFDTLWSFYGLLLCWHGIGVVIAIVGWWIKWFLWKGRWCQHTAPFVCHCCFTGKWTCGF